MIRRLLMVAPRLAALLGTSYFLVATSAPAEPPYTGGSGGARGLGGSSGSKGTVGPCYHASESLRFRVTGNCGPGGEIVVSSPANECAIMVQGTTALGLPAAGRFDSGSTVSLRSTTWHLSGHLPEPGAAGAGRSDAAVFTVQRDAGREASSPVPADAGIFRVVADASADVWRFTVEQDAQVDARDSIAAVDAGADTRVFTVTVEAGTDARVLTEVGAVGADARVFTVLGGSGAATHKPAVVRTCTLVTGTVSSSLVCNDDGRPACEATLTTLP